ncbi:hypothetical protein AB0M28_05450 [Streptomyces sp. NPDC051940]|uniref:hypothetical protein n=1 Tax=Streptomyces sp. NPDC051940 TaxID=3155675 RepID=UPI003445460A
MSEERDVVKRRRVPARVVWALCAALALGTGGWGGYAYASASGDDSLAYAKERDRVLDQGTARLTQLTSIDAKDVPGGLRQWLDATTGALRAELAAKQESNAATLKAGGTTTRARVTDAAVTQLDTRAGTAKLIAALRVEVTGSSAQPATDRKRFEVNLDRTDDGWKIKSITALIVGGES